MRAFAFMQKYARLAGSSRTEIVDMVRPRSNFDLIETRFPNLVTLRRLLSLVRHHQGRTIVLERLSPSRDLIEEDEDVRALRSDFRRSQTIRLSFFTRSLHRAADLSLLTDDDLIGYALVKEDVFRSIRTRRVYESVFRSPSRPNNFIKREPIWTIRVGDKRFRVKGHVYAQQNGISNCCGHVAVRTAVATLGLKNISYRQMNRLLKLSRLQRIPGEGLELSEMVTLLEAAGARCFEADYRAKSPVPAPPFQKYVYGSIESGYPAIISFQTTTDVDSYHAIPIFGHTSNADTWVPSAERSYFEVGAGTRYIPSESWVSMYIGHDDNWGSHYCIPRHYFQTQHPGESGTDGVARADSVESVAHVISTVPKRVRVSPIRAEVLAADYLFALRRRMARLQKNVWAKRLNQHIKDKLVVLRPILVSTSEYCAHLRRVSDWKHNQINPEIISSLEALPIKSMWMVEVSIPELFPANLRKLGEILVRADKKIGRERLMAFFLARLPGYFALLRSIENGQPRFTFIPSGASGHVELIGYEENS
ncbi:MAG TPA: hypothetical protein VII34_06405 [Pyrinomonadaceae bacterium]